MVNVLSLNSTTTGVKHLEARIIPDLCVIRYRARVPGTDLVPVTAARRQT